MFECQGGAIVKGALRMGCCLIEWMSRWMDLEMFCDYFMHLTHCVLYFHHDVSLKTK